jgi:hypothetical protein
MARLEILRNEVPDVVVARRFEREIAAAAALIGPSTTPILCSILDEGLHAEIEIELPGWTERVLVPYPSRVGDVRRAVRRSLQDVGLVEEADVLHRVDVSPH